MAALRTFTTWSTSTNLRCPPASLHPHHFSFLMPSFTRVLSQTPSAQPFLSGDHQILTQDPTSLDAVISSPEKKGATPFSGLGSAGDGLDWELIDAAVDETKASSELSVTVNITKCFVGAASFELPWAFMQAGLLGSVLGVCTLAVLSRISLDMLAKSGHLVKGSISPTYPSIGEQAFGRLGYYTVWFGIIFMTLGVCGSYVVFVASTMADLTDTTKLTWLLIQLPLLIVLSWLRTYKFLSFTSLLGVIALFFAVAFTLSDCIRLHTIGALEEYPMVEGASYPLFMGNAAYLYLISTAILPLSQSMSKPSRFGQCLTTSMLIVTVMNVAFGLVAWMSYGQCQHTGDKECTQGNVIENLAPGPITTLVKILLCVDLVFTNLMFLFPVTEALEVDILGCDALSTPTRVVEAKRNLLRTGVCVGVSVTAYAIPFFNLLTGLSGGFGNNLLGFILPPILFGKMQHDRGYWKPCSIWTCDGRARLWELVVCIALVCFGLGFMGLSTEAFLHKIIEDS